MAETFGSSASSWIWTGVSVFTRTTTFLEHSSAILMASRSLSVSSSGSEAPMPSATEPGRKSLASAEARLMVTMAASPYCEQLDARSPPAACSTSERLGSFGS